MVLADERRAREIATFRAGQVPRRQAGQAAGRQAGEHVRRRWPRARSRRCRSIVKADVQGSQEALAQALLKLSDRRGQGADRARGGGRHQRVATSTSPIASKAVIIGFNVRADAGARKLAEGNGVEIRVLRHHLRRGRRASRPRCRACWRRADAKRSSARPRSAT
jgi:translation initiation factor IF-2